MFYNINYTLMKTVISLILAVFTCTAAYAQMPKVVLNDIHGNSVAVDTIGTHGQPVIVDFFATWCKPCLRELGAIAEVYPDWQEETGMRLVAISIDQAQNINKVKPLADENSWEWDVLLDPNSDVARAFNVKMIPSTLIVDGKGNIIYRHTGYADGAEEELIEKIREIKK